MRGLAKLIEQSYDARTLEILARVADAEAADQLTVARMFEALRSHEKANDHAFYAQEYDALAQRARHKRAGFTACVTREG